MNTSEDLIELVSRIDSRLQVPPIERIYVPPKIRQSGLAGEFGVLVLADGSAGLFFAILSDTLAELHARSERGTNAGFAKQGASVLEVARHLSNGDVAERAIAMGSICALTQHVFKRAKFAPDTARNSTAGRDYGEDDHVGMVGYFPSLVPRLRQQGVRLTVLELREDKVEQGERFEVTLDPGKLACCNSVLCTATTLINGTVDGVLKHCAQTAEVSLIGPTASCFPDPLFQRGVSSIGGSAIRNSSALLQRLDAGEDWGEEVTRYTIESSTYPGAERLLELIESTR